MRKTWKAFLLTFIFILLLGMTGTAAAPTVATIGKKKYTSLEAAYANVKNGQTIKLKRSIKLSEEVKFDRKVKFTLDLGKKTITGINTNGSDMFINKGDVTLKNGTIKGVITTNKDSKLTISSGTYKQLFNLGTTTIKNAKFTRQDQPPVYNLSGKMTIKKATITSKQGCIYISGGTVNIAGGTYKNLDKKNEEPLLTVVKGTLTVSGGKFTGNDCLLFNLGGKVTLKKGSFKSSGYCTIVNSKTMIISGATVNNTGSKYCALYCRPGSVTEVKKGTITGKQLPIIVDSGYKKFILSGGKVQNSTSKMPGICINEGKSSKASVKTKYIKTPCRIKLMYME